MEQQEHSAEEISGRPLTNIPTILTYPSNFTTRIPVEFLERKLTDRFMTTKDMFLSGGLTCLEIMSA